MPKRFNGDRTWPVIKDLITREGPKTAEQIAYYLAYRGLESSTVKYSKTQGQLIDHVRLILAHGVAEGWFVKTSLQYNNV